MKKQPIRWGVISLLICLGLSALFFLPVFSGTPAQTEKPGFTEPLPPLPGPASQTLTIENPLTAKENNGALSAPRILDPATAERRILATPPEEFALFEPFAVFEAGVEAKAVGIDDFNGDGRNDVALTVGWPENKLYVLTQTLTGTLGTPSLYPTGPQPDALATGDLSGDMRPDIVVANFISGTIGVYTQLPSGTLAAPVFLNTGQGPNAVAVGDVNGDDLADVVVTHWLEATIGVFVQQLNGTLATMQTYPADLAGWDDLDIGDLNDDGRNDVVKMNGQFPSLPNLSVYLQDTGGTLQSPAPYDLGEPVGNGLAVGDVTGDGRTDAVMMYGGNRPFSHLVVFSQTLTGTLGITTTYPAFDLPQTVEIGDVNMDGRADVLALHGGWANLTVYLQRENGALAPYESYGLPSPGAGHFGPAALAVGDINSDGQPDIAIADEENGLVILYHRPPRSRFFFPLIYVPIPETETPHFDDFSDPESGWPIIDSIYALFEYQSGEYRILSRDSYLTAFSTAGHRLDDLDARVSIRTVDNPPGAYGLAFGYTPVIPVEEYYLYIVWPDLQEWNLIRFNYGTGYEVMFWGVTGDINPGTGTNRLRVVRQGNFLTLSVNDRQVFNTEIVLYSGSRLIGVLQAPTELFTDTRFDDYALYQP